MPDSTLLETFPTPTTGGSSIVIEHVAEEFTSVCPKTGHPDFATILLRYQPAGPGSAAGAHGCVELKSLKMYYQSFRNEGTFYEAVTGRIRDDLVQLLKPTWLQIATNWRGRGGIRSIIRADFGEVPEAFKASAG
jgi:7-cyano-7-deazaguanine reductase